MAALEEIIPGEKEMFIGLPEITPVTERFYRKIRKTGCSSIRRFLVLIYQDMKNFPLIRQKILCCPLAAKLRHQKARALN